MDIVTIFREMYTDFEKNTWKIWKAFQKGKVGYTTYLDARMTLQLIAEDLAALSNRKEAKRRYDSTDDLYIIAESAVMAARALS